MSAKRTARSRNSSGSSSGRAMDSILPARNGVPGTRGGSVPVCATASADHSAFGAGRRYRIMRHVVPPVSAWR